jgi:hypothetical protein
VANARGEAKFAATAYPVRACGQVFGAFAVLREDGLV